MQKNKQRISHSISRKKTDIGMAKKNHCANDISGASGNDIANILTKERLGGVPTNVAIPPMLEL